MPDNQTVVDEMARDELTRFLLEMYQVAASAPVDEFRPAIFSLLDRLLKIDSAWWGTCVLKKKRIVLVQAALYNLPPEFVDDYIAVADQDPLVGIVDDLDGETIAYSELDENDGIRDFDLKYNLHHGMTCLKKDPISGVGMFISIFRNEHHAGFSESERQRMQALIDHLVQAWSINLRLNLAVQSNAAMPDACVVDADGRLVEISYVFAEKLHLEFPDWDGNVLPEIMRRAVFNAEIGTYRGKAANYRVIHRSDNLVRLECNNVRSLLTPREQAVAFAFAKGNSYKEIAASMNLSPGTVRSYLTQCYSKLNVKNKVELGNALDKR